MSRRRYDYEVCLHVQLLLHMFTRLTNTRGQGTLDFEYQKSVSGFQRFFIVTSKGTT